MKTKQLGPIIKEFNGKECVLRLTNGQRINGIMGEMTNNSSACVCEVVIGKAINIDISIPLLDIDALCLAWFFCTESWSKLNTQTTAAFIYLNAAVVQ